MTLITINRRNVVLMLTLVKPNYASLITISDCVIDIVLIINISLEIILKVCHENTV